MLAISNDQGYLRLKMEEGRAEADRMLVGVVYELGILYPYPMGSRQAV
jgi:hypothetical protein